MAELPDDGDRGKRWRVRVPVVFEIAARSWAQARGIVDQALTSRSIGALAAPEGATAVLNAANEVAVGSFLHREIRFHRIPAVIEETLSRARFSKPGDLADLMAIDAEARQLATDCVSRLKGT